MAKYLGKSKPKPKEKKFLIELTKDEAAVVAKAIYYLAWDGPAVELLSGAYIALTDIPGVHGRLNRLRYDRSNPTHVKVEWKEGE